MVSNNDCLDELEAAHIIPFSECNNFDINNGLLLSANLHKTFDKIHWTIDTNTNCIVVLNNNSNSIKKYDGKYINLDNKTLQYFIKRNNECDISIRGANLDNNYNYIYQKKIKINI